MNDAAAAFSGFSDLWAPGRWGDLSWWFLPLNTVACGLIVLEAIWMLNLSHNRGGRIVFGFLAFAAFAYFAGEVSGEYRVVAPVETMLHWACVFGLGTRVWGARHRASSY